MGASALFCALYSLRFTLCTVLRPALFTPCTLYALHSLRPALFTPCTLYALHSLRPALFTPCTLYALHFDAGRSYSPLPALGGRQAGVAASRFSRTVWVI